jgi:hypothetical protein
MIQQQQRLKLMQLVDQQFQKKRKMLLLNEILYERKNLLILSFVVMLMPENQPLVDNLCKFIL